MDAVDFIILVAIMALMAAVPSTSVVVVVSRSVTHGFASGAAAAAGIVSGDLVFVAVALAGVSAVASTLGEYFVVAKILGGLYLIWLGISLLRRRGATQAGVPGGASLLHSYLSGLLLTLGDLKAVFFYASLLPAFVEVGQLGVAGSAAVVSATVLTVGTVKLAYAYASHRAGVMARTRRHGGAVTGIAGGVAVGAGVLVLARA